jgi:hypothetical protein
VLNFDLAGDIETTTNTSENETLDNATGHHIGVVCDLGLGPVDLRSGLLYRNVGSYDCTGVPEIDPDEVDVTAFEVGDTDVEPTKRKLDAFALRLNVLYQPPEITVHVAGCSELVLNAVSDRRRIRLGAEMNRPSSRGASCDHECSAVHDDLRQV